MVKQQTFYVVVMEPVITAGAGTIDSTHTSLAAAQQRRDELNAGGHPSVFRWRVDHK